MLIQHSRTEKVLTTLLKIIPILSIIVVSVGLIFLSIWLKRSDVILKGQYLAFPIIVGSIIVICCRSCIMQPLATTIVEMKFNKKYFYLLFVFLYILSIILLLNSYKLTFLYIILIGLLSFMIFLEILTYNKSEKPAIVLSQIILLFTNIIFGQTLRLPLYFGYTDILPHMRFIESIISNYHVTSQMDSYQYFPLYHIFVAMSNLIFNIDFKTSYFVSTGIAFLSSIILVYLIAYKITSDIKKSLIISLFYSLSTEIIFSGLYMVTRVMSYVIFLLICYIMLVFSDRFNKQKFYAMAIFLIFPLVFMHQISLVHEVIILLTFILLEFFLYREVKTFSPGFIILFTVSFIGYWIYVAGPFFQSVIKTIASTSEVVVTPTTQNIEPIYKTLLGQIDKSIIAFFLIIGINILIGKGIAEKQKNKLGVLCAIFSFLAMPFFFPGPAAYLTSLLLSYRIPLMVMPFMVIPVVEGMFSFLRPSAIKLANIAKFSFVSLLFVIYALSTNLILANSIDMNLNKFLITSSRTYFTESELSGFKFCIDKINKDKIIYSDYESCRYLLDYAGRSSSASSKIIEDPQKFKSNYFLYRYNHLAERNQLAFIAGTVGFMNKTIIVTNENHKKLALFNRYDKVYENKNLLIYLLI